MATRQIDQKARQERNQHVTSLISTLETGIAQHARSGGESDLWSWDITKLESELDGMRGHIRRTLKRSKPQDYVAIDSTLFGEDRELATITLRAWLEVLRGLRLDRIAKKAVRIHFLAQQARDVLPYIEAARRERLAGEEAVREAAFQVRVAEEQPRELHWGDVVRLVREAGHTPDTWGSPSGLYGQARTIGVITDLEYEVASRRNPRGWNYAGD